MNFGGEGDMIQSNTPALLQMSTMTEPPPSVLGAVETRVELSGICQMCVIRGIPLYSFHKQTEANPVEHSHPP